MPAAITEPIAHAASTIPPVKRTSSHPSQPHLRAPSPLPPPRDAENRQPNLQLQLQLPPPPPPLVPSQTPLLQQSQRPPLYARTARSQLLPEWNDEADFDTEAQPCTPAIAANRLSLSFPAPRDEYDDEHLALHEHHMLHDEHDLDDVEEEDDEDEDDDEEDEEDDDSEIAPLNYFVHNGFRYDGDIFELRPPQERSIASRPERVLEHKPALLSNRQTFNRVYSEGTYNARPSSLRQPRNTSSRFSSSSVNSSASTTGSDAQHDECIPVVKLDTPATTVRPLPVTRPPSVRPPPVAIPADGPLSPRGLCKTIEAVRQSASSGNGNQNLQGLLAYSAIPVTRISGEKPDLHLPKPPTAPTLPTALSGSASHGELRSVRQQPGEYALGNSSTRVEEYNAHSHQSFDEGRRPNIVREKRGRSYTSFAKSTPFSNAGDPSRSGRLQQTHSTSSAQKRTPFWKGILLSR